MSGVRIWLMGGLGNQLFQVNYGEWLREEHQIEVSYCNYLCESNLVTKYTKWSIHPFVLQKLLDLEVHKHPVFSLSFILAIKASINSISMFYGLDTIPKKPSRNCFGYFQCRDFLANYPHTLRPLLKRGSEPNTESVVMHYRTGDINNRSAADDYYHRVLSDLKPSKIRLVSNSQKDANDLSLHHKKHDFLVHPGSLIEDFVEMSSALHLICAPSTLSWWAARLGGCMEITMPDSLFSQLGSPRPDLKVNLL